MSAMAGQQFVTFILLTQADVSLGISYTEHEDRTRINFTVAGDSIPGYNLLIILGVASMITPFFYKKVHKSRKI